MQLRIAKTVIGWLMVLTPAVCAQVSVDRRVELDAKRGPDIERKTIDVRIPYGSLRYTGIARTGSIRGIAEKWGDQMFGLSFNRPAATNGGWSLAGFVNVVAKVGQESVEPQKQYLLEDVYVLETERRTMLHFVWPLSEKTPSTGKLIVTTLQYPSQKDWVFVGVQVVGTDAAITRIDLSCSPGNTSGPKERERWVATQQGTFELRDRANVDLPAGDFGIAYFNKLAQQNAGCFLVFDPKSVRSAAVVNGGYNVATRLAPRAEGQPIRLALGGFVDQSSEVAVRYFLQERADQMAVFLKNIDWSARIDVQKYDALLREVRTLAIEMQDNAAATKLTELSAAYQQALGAGQTVRVMEIIEQVKQTKESLIQRALKQFE